MQEYIECSGRGQCQNATGTCQCFAGYGSSDGRGREGTRADCGYQLMGANVVNAVNQVCLAGDTIGVVWCSVWWGVVCGRCPALHFAPLLTLSLPHPPTYLLLPADVRRHVAVPRG